ncbi:MAG: hypothetical protein AAFO03_29195, partial [Bacteroidota bacterium]
GHDQRISHLGSMLEVDIKQFDTYFYPNRNHGIYGGPTRLHLYSKMTEFLNDNLKGKSAASGRPTGVLRVEPMRKGKE